MAQKGINNDRFAKNTMTISVPFTTHLKLLLEYDLTKSSHMYDHLNSCSKVISMKRIVLKCIPPYESFLCFLFYINLYHPA